MKIHVARMDQEVIEGYKHVVLTDDYINFADVSDNECELILANDVLDSFTAVNIKNCVVSLVSKLRLGGTIIIGGKDIRMFSRFVMNNMISEAEASSIISEVRSMPNAKDIVNGIKSLGLNVQTVNTTGIHFEVVARRG